MLIVELSEAAPVERPPFETAEATEGEEDAAGVVEEAVEDGNRSPDSISKRSRKCEFSVSETIHKN